MSEPFDLTRAAGPGRVRGIGLDLYTRALSSPRAAGGVLRRGLREARALHSRERRLVAELIYGLIRRQGLLDRALGTDDPLARWLGQLVWLGLPVADAAQAWQVERGGEAPPFGAEASLVGLSPEEALAVQAGVSVDIARSLQRAFGGEAARFVEASNQRAPVTLRIGRGQRDLAVRRLREAGLEAAPTAIPTGVRLPPGVDLQHHPALEGLVWELQDEASQRVAALVQPGPGETVLDLCAGAGGKSLAIADACPRARVQAWDVRPRALDELARRARQAGVKVTIAPPREPVAQVLVDAPCSGTGTWRRHPELRWRLGDLPGLTQTQQELLDQAAPLVRPGGQLIYATCSVLPEEDEDAVAAFVQRHPEFSLQGEPLRTAPHLDDSDGFFAAVLRRG